MIRFICAAIFVTLTVIISTPILLLLWVFGLAALHARDLAARQIVRFFFWGIIKISGVDITYIGLDRIPKKRGVVYISNHQSMFDIIAVYNKFPGITGYLAKKELSKIPLFGLWMQFVHCIFVDRGNHDKAAESLRLGAEELNTGISCYVFPEGTRNKGEEDELLPFKGGAFKIAEHARCPIVPIAITGTRDIFERH
ncbi:MAG: 1-acyl-sn-glycerol-3-phosphate acyltransferase, partial [Lachnospiraceae bacterium]|nr:1-acyl-sn-glycerol-3-phosphate acyltransferase [Lachnospiraceae bacterium]